MKYTIITIFILTLFNITVQANTYKNKNVTAKDYMRTQRLTACEEAYNNSGLSIPYINNKAPTVACAIRMHWVYIYESATGQSDLCKNRNVCLWLKHTVNWYYWFNRYKSQQEEMNLFAEKYFKYHYTKSAFTFIHWYKQKDWTYRWWRSTTDVKPYTRFLQSIENNYWLTQEYEYLYFANNQ